MPQIKAEVIAIGDELTTGVRLDTNTQWLSQRLGELGVKVAFHTTVGDDQGDLVEAFQTAAGRANLIVVTGGLGPTADDLTRQTIADMAGVGLVLHEPSLKHIEKMFHSRGREMSENNRIQAMFPEGAVPIPNPEGTAPGVDYSSTNSAGNHYRILALPGVPVEMKQMWDATIEPAVRELTGDTSVILHHTIRCFGSGESHIESMLPNLIARGRDPQVGITASSATISLRVTTRGDSIEHCCEKMQPTLETIKSVLGDLVFGEDDDTLALVVVRKLLMQNRRLRIWDAGLHGAVAKLIAEVDVSKSVFAGGILARAETPDLSTIAAQISSPEFHTGIDQPELLDAVNDTQWVGLAIGPISRDEQLVTSGESLFNCAISVEGKVVVQQFRFSGHSGWREIRAAKDVLNFLRLTIANGPVM